MELVQLESGQNISVHCQDKCNGQPCVIHNQVDGPWSEWPRMFHEANSITYRICPHRIAHPSVEDVARILRGAWTGEQKVRYIQHACCEICVCLPRAGLPAEVFYGPAIPVVLPVERLDEDASASDKNPDPNWWAQDYISIQRSVMDVNLWILLSDGVLNKHHINSVDAFSEAAAVDCDNECITRIELTNGTWRIKDRDGNHWCPAVAIACLAGWIPQNWSFEDEEEDP
jgi:hypothetical protein